MRSSIAELADACKLSRGALYHCFDSKVAILLAISDAYVRRMIVDVEAAIMGASTALEQFRVYTMMLFGILNFSHTILRATSIPGNSPIRSLICS